MGDHDARFLNDLEGYIPKVEGELEHYKWSNSMLNSSLKDKINQWPFIIHDEFNNVKISFAHYGLNQDENGFLPIVYEPKIADIDSYFEKYNRDLVFFGHTHKIFNSFGKSHYLNPGAIGVNNKSHIPYIMLDINDNGTYNVTQFQVPYSIEKVIDAFNQRKVPNKDQIIRIFYL